MYPFIDLGLFRLPTYGLLLCVAILLGVPMAVSRSRVLGIDREFAYAYLSVTVVVALLGAKLTDWIIGRGVLSLNTVCFRGRNVPWWVPAGSFRLLCCCIAHEDPAAAVG